MADLEGIKLGEGDGYIYYNGQKLPITDFSINRSNGRSTTKLIYGSMNNNNNEETKTWNTTLVLVEEQLRTVLQFADSTDDEFQVIWVHNAPNDTIRYTFEGCLLNDENINLASTNGGTVPVSGTYKTKTIA